MRERHISATKKAEPENFARRPAAVLNGEVDYHRFNEGLSLCEFVLLII
jgi:hypothetical protein